MSRLWGLSCVLYASLSVTNLWSYGPPDSDQQLLLKIEQEMQQYARRDGTKVQVRVSGGIANIAGEVPSYADRMHLERLCRRVDGVTGVDNRLQVVPVWVSDEALTRIVKERLAADSLLRSQNIEVSARSGVVMLSGTVPTWTDRRRATASARQVQGVANVQNEIAVSGPNEGPRATVPDATIKSQLRKLLSGDSPLAPLELKYRLEHGTVELEGGLFSLRQKTFLRDVVQAIPGVVHVDTRKLRVTTEPQASAIAFVDENSAAARQAMLQLIIDAASMDPPHKVSVQLQDGGLVLEGEVDSLAQQQRLLELTKAFGGAFPVANRIVVNPPQRTDEAIERELRAVLRNDALLSEAKLELTVQEGEATVTGRVTDFNTKARVARIATRIAGLAAVHNRVTVSWSPNVSDDGLKRVVEKKLHDEFAAEAAGIEVAVADGRVTLSGTITAPELEKTLVERVEAIDCIRSVRSMLAVAPMPASIASH